MTKLLRVLLTVSAIVAAAALSAGGLLVRSARTQQAVVVRLVEAGAKVTYESPGDNTPALPSGASLPRKWWQVSWLGDDFFFSVRRVRFPAPVRLEPLVGDLSNLSGIQYVYFDDKNQVTDEVIQALGTLRDLRELDLTHTRVSDDGMRWVAGLVKLRWLALASTRVSDAGLENIDGLNDLEYLDLSFARVSDRGLCEMGAKPHLKVLLVVGTVISDQSIEVLRSFPCLERIYVRNTRITDTGKAKLEAAFPDAIIE